MENETEKRRKINKRLTNERPKTKRLFPNGRGKKAFCRGKKFFAPTRIPNVSAVPRVPFVPYTKAFRESPSGFVASNGGGSVVPKGRERLQGQLGQGEFFERENEKFPEEFPKSEK
jgi:hypothetical protein